MNISHNVPDEFPLAMRRLVENGQVHRESDPDSFRILAKGTKACTDILAHRLGMRLVIGTDSFVIRNRPASPDPAIAPEWLIEGHAARGLALFLYILWYAEQSTSDIAVLSDIANAIQEEARDTGVEYDWTKTVDRRMLRYAMEQIQSLGYAEVREGSAEEWADETGASDLLIEWRPVNWNYHGPLSTEGARMITDTQHDLPSLEHFLDHPTPENRLYRWLLFHPILLAEEDPEAFAILLDERRETRVRKELVTFFGYQLERCDWFARVRSLITKSDADVTAPVSLAADETKVATLIAAEVRNRIAAGDPNLTPINGNVRISLEFLEQIAGDLQHRYGENWKAQFRSGSPNLIVKHVLPRMLRLGLARISEAPVENEKTVLITAAAAPLAPSYVQKEKAEVAIC